MKRTTAFILCAIMVLGMIPTSLLSVIAADNGVIWNETQNQSQNNAATQAIPESVTVDGVVSTDTAWANNKWNEVDKNNGTWDTDSPAEASKALTYKYQLHYDYEYFYGAIVLGDGIKNADITVWLNDGTNAAGGYTHKISFAVANGSVTDNGMVKYVNGADEKVTADAEYASQQYLFASNSDDNVTIEFRRFLTSFTAANASDIKYFVSVKYNGDTLYFPRIKVEGQLNVNTPGHNYWPTAANSDNHLTHQADSDTLSPITIDGKFDEAAWAGLTGFYTDGKSDQMVDYKDGEKVQIDFSDVHYNGTYQPSANSANDKLVGSDGTIGTGNLLNTNNSQSEEVKFKYVYRTDGEYFYCAVVAEVPKLYYEGFLVAGKDVDGLMDADGSAEYDAYVTKSQPTLTIMFYNQTDSYYDYNGNPYNSSNFASLPNQTSDAASAFAKYNGWAAEHMISINTYRPNDDINASTSAGSFHNVSSRLAKTKEGKYNGYIDGVFWGAQDGDDTEGQDLSKSGYQGAYALQDTYTDYDVTWNNKYAEVRVWYFETRVKLDAIKSSEHPENDLYFTISISDRPWVDAIATGEHKGTYGYSDGVQYNYAGNYYRNSAWTGTDTSVKSPFYYYKNGHQIFDADFKGNSISGIVIDSNLEKHNTAALVGADMRIDGTDRNKGYAEKNAANGTLQDSSKEYDGQHVYNKYTAAQYTYVLTADHEYAYLAGVFSNISDGDQLRLWTKRPNSTEAGYEHCITLIYDADRTSDYITYDSWWGGGSNQTGNHSDFKIASDRDTARNLVFLEFRVALSEIGVTPDLSPAANDLLFTYYFSLEKWSKHSGQTSSTNNGLVHPRCDTTSFPSVWDAEHAGRVFYQTPNASTLTGRPFDHNDATLLTYIAIDGKLEEEIWNQASDRISVNGDNGKWTVTPVKNDVFEYSYVIYVGDNFIYGAVEVDVDAVKATNDNYNYGNGKYTSIELWLSNLGSVDEWGNYYEGKKYDNYYYNIYLCDDEYSGKEFAVSGPSGLVYGGSEPQVENDYYKWGMTTANGKTYAEFMISTDSYQLYEDDTLHNRFSMNETLGADYFISVKHPTDDDENLKLTYPVINDMFYLTHFESIHSEGAGVIYTDLTGTGDSNYLYSMGRWWVHVLFKRDTASGGWKIVGIKDGNKSGTADPASGGKTRYGFSAAEMAALGGDFVYCVNVGNNYIDVIERLKENFEKLLAENGHTEETISEGYRATLMAQITAAGGGVDQYYSHEQKAAMHVDLSSIEAYNMQQAITGTWAVGDIIKIPGLDPNGDVETQVKAMLAAQAAQQTAVTLQRYVDEYSNILVSAGTQTSYVNPAAEAIEYAVPQTVVAIPRYYESGYKFIHTYEMVTENTDWDNNLPTASKWNETNYGTLDMLVMDYPEKITVDGNLNDTGWDADQWITVNNGINSTLQSNSSNAFQLKYQMRVDGEYIYVAAVYEGVKYDSANKPVFWLWTNDKADQGENWTKYYKIGYNNGGKNYALDATVPALKDYYSNSADVKYTNLESGKNSVIGYYNELDVVTNDTPNVSINDNTNTSLGYDNSAFYGFTDTVEESCGGRYYPDINIVISEHIFGKQCAVMKAGDGTSVNGFTADQLANSTVVEFRIGIDEVDPDRDGFEYFVSAARFGQNGSDYTMFYPNIYCEPDSEFCYHNYSMPFWKWYSDTSAKITPDDYVGDRYLCNEYAPVVTLGAKFNPSFTYTSKGTQVTAGALRFGGLYTEDMIRRCSGDKNATYWDITEMGIVLVRTSKLGEGQELTIDTVGAQRATAVGIVDWQADTNFADYESFAFYVTVGGMPDNDEARDIKFSARTYVCYRDLTDTAADSHPLDRDGDGVLTHGTNAKDYYGQTIVRSATMINDIVNSGIGDNEQGNLPQ